MKPILLDALRGGVFEGTLLEEGHRAVEVLVVVIVVILRLRIAVRDGILTVGVNDSRRSVVVLLIVAEGARVPKTSGPTDQDVYASLRPAPAVLGWTSSREPCVDG